MFGHDVTGIDFSPFSIRMACATKPWIGYESFSTAQIALPYFDWNAVRKHRDEYVDALRKVYGLTRGRSGLCNISLPCATGKFHIFDCSQIESDILGRLIDNSGFWHKHLGIVADDYDRQWERIANKVLMTAVPLTVLEFYRELLGDAGLKLHSLSLSCMDYFYLMRSSARCFLTLSLYEVCLMRNAPSGFDFKHIAVADTPFTQDILGNLIDKVAVGLSDDMRNLQGDTVPVEVVPILPSDIGADAPNKLHEVFLEVGFKWVEALPETGAVVGSDMHRCVSISNWRMPARQRSIKTILSDSKRVDFIATRAGWLTFVVVMTPLLFWYFGLRGENQSLSPSFAQQLERVEQYSRLRLSESKVEQKLAYWKRLHKKAREVLDARDAPPDFFRLLSATLPTRFRLDKVHCKGLRNCRLAGVAPSYQELVLFLKDLEGLDDIRRATVKDVAGVGKMQAMKFLIECDYTVAYDDIADAGNR